MGTDNSFPGQCASARQHTATVAGVRQLARDTWAVKLDCVQLGRDIVPGQFFMIRPQQGSDPLLGRPFALFDVCRDELGNVTGVEFGFVRVGKLTSLMAGWREGDRVSVWGPLGNGFPVPACEHLICVAGGIGQTPFLAVAREALGHAIYGSPARVILQRPQTTSLLYGVRSSSYLAGLEDFRMPGLTVDVATDDGSAGQRGYVTALLEERLRTGTAGVHVYCCGPEPMMRATATVCERYGVPCWLSLETPMACGFGACFSCVTKVRQPDGGWDYRRTCIEGPVFRAEQLELSEH